MKWLLQISRISTLPTITRCIARPGGLQITEAEVFIETFFEVLPTSIASGETIEDPITEVEVMEVDSKFWGPRVMARNSSLMFTLDIMLQWTTTLPIM